MFRKLQKIKNKLAQLWQDDNFLASIHSLENLVSKILSIALIIVIVFSLIDLIRFLVTDLFGGERYGFFTTKLIEIFGLFLNILIALELLENITAYLKKHIIQVELVIVTSLIAVARKVIIFDVNKYTSNDLIALGLAAIALSASYWLLKQINNKPQ